MKKFIQITAVLSLLFVFTAIGVNAQTEVKSFDAKVPFDFNIGSKFYQAGHYTLKINKTATNGLQLTVLDQERNILQSILVADSGDIADAESHLVFNNYNNQRFLSKIKTLNKGIDIFMTKTEKEAARRQTKSKTVASVTGVR